MKVILLTGNACSGKTVFAYLLAQKFAQKRKTILIESDSERPTLKMLLPDAKDDAYGSLGALLAVPEITPLAISESLYLASNNLGVLSYCRSDNRYTYAAPTETTLEHFFQAVSMIADIILIDTQSVFTPLDVFIRKHADVEIMVISGDSKGYVWSRKHTSNAAKEILLVNHVSLFSAVEDTARSVEADFVLPYCKALGQIFCQASIDTVVPARGFQKIVSKIVDTIQNDEAFTIPDEDGDDLMQEDEYEDENDGEFLENAPAEEDDYAYYDTEEEDDE